MKLNSAPLKIYQVDTFTNKIFHGNPAAVCILKKPIKDELMQSIALEINLSETAFLLLGERDLLENPNVFSLRWFTPKFEVSLCGHATLATSAVLFNEYNLQHDKIIYDTKSGKLITKRDKNMIILDFPADKDKYYDFSFKKELLNAMGISNITILF